MLSMKLANKYDCGGGEKKKKKKFEGNENFYVLKWAYGKFTRTITFFKDSKIVQEKKAPQHVARIGEEQLFDEQFPE